MANKIKIAGTTSNTFTVGTNSTGNIKAGNYLYSNGQPISTVTIVNLSANNGSNLTALTSHVGNLIVYSGSGNTIIYEIPNVASANFSVGSRIEIFADSSATITVTDVWQAGVTVLASKNLNSSTTISNIQSATLTMISTDKWYMGP
jgi:hypothetical protein